MTKQKGLTSMNLFLGGIAVAILAGLFILAWEGSEYSRVDSPDGNHYIVARKSLSGLFFFAMPGGGGDAPGTFTLYDRSGKRLARANVPMVNLVFSLHWASDSVSLPGDFWWDLPTGIQSR